MRVLTLILTVYNATLLSLFIFAAREMPYSNAEAQCKNLLRKNYIAEREVMGCIVGLTANKEERGE